MIEINHIKESIRNLDDSIDTAYGQFREWELTGDEFMEPSWLIESCFFQAIAIAEALNLDHFRELIKAEYNITKESKDKFLEAGQDPDGEAYSITISKIRKFLRTFQSFFPKEESTKITKDLLQIIRDIHYVIADKELFRSTPANENDVHIRIEGILKCVFSDLKHKPVLTKQIKNFTPDTGIPSIETLIEYKFLSRKEDVAGIADEVLADTRGYVSKDWKRFLYVIYETHRFRTEKDWQEFLKQSGVLDNTMIVVLSGEPPKKSRKKKESSQPSLDKKGI